MNKKEKIKFYQTQIANSKEMQAVAMQNFSLAARLEDSAKSALQVLGAPEEQGRKVKHQLPEKERMKLLSNLTGTHGRSN